jgi:hypothetical protein
MMYSLLTDAKGYRINNVTLKIIIWNAQFTIPM